MVAVSAMGVPTISLLAGLDRSGLPLGVQVISSRFCEATRLDVAEIVERQFGRVTPIEPAAVSGRS